jgi:hypothetical protein
VETRNFTCVAASKLGVIETHSLVKVQGEPRIRIPVFADPDPDYSILDRTTTKKEG